jgi:hypothetical protein
MEAIARLSADVGNQDEFSGRLSTLSDLLKNLQTHNVSGVSGHALKRLKAYLCEQLRDLDDQDSIENTLTALRNITQIRNGLQHSPAAREGVTAWHDLGLRYPPTDWNDAWSAIRSIATEAVMDLRNLVEKLPQDGCTERTHQQ